MCLLSGTGEGWWLVAAPFLVLVVLLGLLLLVVPVGVLLALLVLSLATVLVLLWCVGVVLAGGRTPTTADAPAVRA